MGYKDKLYCFEEFAETFLKIKDEFGEIVPFRFNTSQQKVLERIRGVLGIDRLDIRDMQGIALRLIILKARQQGISTLMQGFVFWWNYIKKNQKALTMGHKSDASRNLFDIYKRFYDELPSVMRPTLERNNENKIKYLKRLSENKIDTAGSGEIGRSDTFQAIHLTEVAFYPDAKTTFTGLLQSAKYASIHVIETTANGYNEAQKRWRDSKEGRSKYVPIFLSWLEFPDYVINAKRLGFIQELDEEGLAKFKQDIGNPLYNEYPGEEQILLEKYGASIEQLQWRRYAIMDLCDGDVTTFHQEYPRDESEAFIASGSPFFNLNIVMQQRSESQVPLKRGDLVIKYNESESYHQAVSEGARSLLELKPYVSGVEFVESSRGFISIWDDIKVKEGEYYRFAGGSDIAEGLEQGDYTTCKILDRKTDKMVMSWRGHLDPDVFAEELYKIWLYLGKDCYFAIEKNNHGLTTINHAYKLGIPQYYKSTFTKGYEQSTSSLGFRLDSKSRPFVLNQLNENIRESLFIDRDKIFWDECTTFVKNARGKAQAQDKDKNPGVKCYDDTVFAGAYAIEVARWLPNYQPIREHEIRSRPPLVGNSRTKGSTRF